jgi:hypothetical protein
VRARSKAPGERKAKTTDVSETKASTLPGLNRF